MIILLSKTFSSYLPLICLVLSMLPWHFEIKTTGKENRLQFQSSHMEENGERGKATILIFTHEEKWREWQDDNFNFLTRREKNTGKKKSNFDTWRKMVREQRQQFKFYTSRKKNRKEKKEGKTTISIFTHEEKWRKRKTIILTVVGIHPGNFSFESRRLLTKI
jgi:hypothetical protein